MAVMIKIILYQVIWHRHEKRNKNYVAQFYQKTVHVFITNMGRELVSVFVFVAVAVGIWKCLWKVWDSVTRECVGVCVDCDCAQLFAIWYLCVLLWILWFVWYGGGGV